MPRKSPKTLILAASALAIAVGIAAPSLAAPGDPAPQQTAADGKPLPLRAEVLFKLLDRNNDGKIDADEAATFQKAIFDAVDTNHDGALSTDEFPRFAGMGAHRPRPGMQLEMGHGPRFGHGPWQADGQRMMGRGPMFGQGPQGGPSRPSFESLDTNHDGSISPEEFAAGAPPPPNQPPQQ